MVQKQDDVHSKNPSRPPFFKGRRSPSLRLLPVAWDPLPPRSVVARDPHCARERRVPSVEKRVSGWRRRGAGGQDDECQRREHRKDGKTEECRHMTSLSSTGNSPLATDNLQLTTPNSELRTPNSHRIRTCGRPALRQGREEPGPVFYAQEREDPVDVGGIDHVPREKVGVG